MNFHGKNCQFLKVGFFRQIARFVLILYSNQRIFTKKNVIFLSWIFSVKLQHFVLILQSEKEVSRKNINFWQMNFILKVGFFRQIARFVLILQINQWIFTVKIVIFKSRIFSSNWNDLFLFYKETKNFDGKNVKTHFIVKKWNVKKLSKSCQTNVKQMSNKCQLSTVKNASKQSYR